MNCRPDRGEEALSNGNHSADTHTSSTALGLPKAETQADSALPSLPYHVMCSITAMYGELAKVYAELEPEMEERAIGARILISPPHVGADIMFIAYQPGDSSGFQKERGCEATWPDENEYATRNWPLAMAIRRLVSREVLQSRTVVTNLVFWRAKKKSEWDTVPESPRKAAEMFSLKQVLWLIKLLQPRAIVAIGFDALKNLVPTNCKTLERRRGNGERDRLVCKGQIDGRPVVGIPHLSGCRPGISREENEVIAGYLKELLAN